MCFDSFLHRNEPMHVPSCSESCAHHFVTHACELIKSLCVEKRHGRGAGLMTQDLISFHLPLQLPFCLPGFFLQPQISELGPVSESKTPSITWKTRISMVEALSGRWQLPKLWSVEAHGWEITGHKDLEAWVETVENISLWSGLSKPSRVTKLPFAFFAF